MSAAASIHRANLEARFAATRAANRNRVHVDRAPIDRLEELIIAAVAAGGRP